jgi:hypothetical protein
MTGKLHASAKVHEADNVAHRVEGIRGNLIREGFVQDAQTPGMVAVLQAWMTKVAPRPMKLEIQR